MLSIIAGIFLVLHGLVHLLYAGQSARFIELRPGMTWPEGSWLFSRLLGDETSRLLATVMLLFVAISYIAGGAELIFRQEWWRATTVGAALLSSLIFILFWDGGLQALDAKGGVGIFINVAILVIILILKWHP